MANMLCSNPQSYEPQFKEEAARDYYADIRSAKKKKNFIFHQLPGAADDIQATLDGKYLIYYDTNSWYAYNVLRQFVHLQQQDLFEEPDPNDYNSEPRVYGICRIFNRQ
jgi:hypothetical protein